MAVTIFKGANRFESDDVVGSTVGSLKEHDVIVDALNLDGNEKIKVNSSEKSDSYVLRDGDSVEFYKPQGNKG